MDLLMFFGDGIGTLVDALMADYAKAHVVDAVARTAFYSNLDLATNLFGAVMQLRLTRWLLIRHGAGWGLLLPALVNVALLGAVALVGGGELAVFGYGVPVLGVMQVIMRGFAYGFTTPSGDAL